jgi:hypothetical protein
MASQGGFIRLEPVAANVAPVVEFTEGFVTVGPPATANVVEDCATIDPEPSATQIQHMR